MKKNISVSIITAVLLLSGCGGGGGGTSTPTTTISKSSVAYTNDLKIGESYPISKFNISLGQATFSNGKVLNATYGLGSGAYHNPSEAQDIVYIVTDRGVNIKCADDEDIIGTDLCEKGKIFPFPEFTPTIIKAKLSADSISIEEIIEIKDSAGKNISGISNPLSNFTEIAYNIDGAVLEYDPNGLDVEALIKLNDGSFWISEEYASSLVHVAADGKIITRLVPQGLESDLVNSTYKVEGKLPSILSKRHANRGIESIAISPDEKTLYYIMQSPLDNDDYANTNRVRLYSMNLSDFSHKEYLYEIDEPDTFVKDNESKTRVQKDVKISEMLALPSGELLILERISSTTKLYKINLSTATEVPSDKSNDLENNDFDSAISKIKVFDTETRPELFPNKVEGVAHLGGDKFFMINDNDFGIEGDDVVAQTITLDVTSTPVKKDIPGRVVFFNADGTYNASVTAGILPDMVSFTHDGKKVLVANEAQPVGEEEISDVYYDPFGSVSIIDVDTKDVTQIDFKSITTAPIGSKIKKDTEVARDFEPEYITISDDDKTAWVALQESNAIAKIDLETNTLSTVFGLGFKDLSLAKNSLDYKKDSTINLETTPQGVYGMYQPDTIKTYNVSGVDYIITANEGDDRDDFYDETTKASKLTHNFGELGDLRVNPDLGDADGDGVYEELYSYGARSFSIFNGTTGELVYDSANEFESTVANTVDAGYFNTRPKKGKWYDTDERSEKKGVEPEALSIAKIGSKTFAYIGLEKQGGFFVYDITNPLNVSQVQYNNDIDYTKSFDTDGPVPSDIDDMGPEGSVTFTQNSKDYLALANEVSGTISLYELSTDGKATKQGTYHTGIYYDSAAEIVVYEDSKLYVTNASTNSIMVLNIADVTNITKLNDINLDAYGTGVNSVDIHNGLIAVAVERKE